ncbi:MAG: hypothetical protein BGO39_17005 [Chloroflexi bacterium 54-19]|nr:MAG: hypothetical protein BGO39_17005 [Chloroflexi bacterium 54-19]
MPAKGSISKESGLAANFFFITSSNPLPLEHPLSFYQSITRTGRRLKGGRADDARLADNQPPQEQVFTNNIYTKTGEDGELVPVYTAVVEDRDPWDTDLTQDETAESQLFFGDDWPDKPLFPLLD